MAKKDGDKGKRDKGKSGKKIKLAAADQSRGEERRSKGKSKSEGGSSGAAEALFKLAEHPIVADLIAVGATAAVAAIVKSKSDQQSGKGSSRAVKDAGKAAAAAIGARLMDEFKAVKAAAKDKAKDGEAA